MDRRGSPSMSPPGTPFKAQGGRMWEQGQGNSCLGQQQRLWNTPEPHGDSHLRSSSPWSQEQNQEQRGSISCLDLVEPMSSPSFRGSSRGSSACDRCLAQAACTHRPPGQCSLPHLLRDWQLPGGQDLPSQPTRGPQLRGPAGPEVSP